MFDMSSQAIYLLLERDCFPRYKQSKYFQDFLSTVENFNVANISNNTGEKRIQEEKFKLRSEETFEQFSPQFHNLADSGFPQINLEETTSNNDKNGVKSSG